MAHKGCMNGCIYYKPIKLSEMKASYHFRCKKQNKFFTKDELKSRCHLFEGVLKIKEHTVEEFLNTDE